MINKQKTVSLALAAVVALAGILITLLNLSGNKGIYKKTFDEDRAFNDAVFQVSLGPRMPSNEAHKETIRYIEHELANAGWSVEMQISNYLDRSITNIVAKRGESTPVILLGAHYDSRILADKDPEPAKRTQPVPGANDGASGVAVLLELGRSLPYYQNGQVWLVFFDAEDQGKIPGWDWIIGSNLFASELTQQIEAVVIVDMIGDMDLNIKIEQNSSPELVDEIWGQAADLGYSDHFLQQPGYSILDDHIPFLKKGIASVDIIDFDYPYWHTTSDTIDKISPDSLEVVGVTLQHWLDKRFE